MSAKKVHPLVWGYILFCLVSLALGHMDQYCLGLATRAGSVDGDQRSAAKAFYYSRSGISSQSQPETSRQGNIETSVHLPPL